MTAGRGLHNFLFSVFGFKKAYGWGQVLLIIFVHAFAWCLLFSLPVLLYPVQVIDDIFIRFELLDKLFLVAIFYLNYYLLIPLFFERRKILLYLLLVCIVFLLYVLQQAFVRKSYFAFSASAIMTAPADIIRSDSVSPGRVIHFQDTLRSPGAGWVIARHYPDTLAPMQNVLYEHNLISYTDSMHEADTKVASITPVAGFTTATPVAGSFIRAVPFVNRTFFGIPQTMWLSLLNNAISPFVLVLVIGGFIRLAYSFVRNQNERRALENAKLNAELNFLKSQINPHFLFNTLNSIYSQAHHKSEHTESSILRLSELLRYVIYESGENKVPLEKDIRYINNYIDLQRMRLSSKVTINYVVEGDFQHYMIAPLLCICFIENAFIHGISYSNASVVNIIMRVFGETLTLHVSNPLVRNNNLKAGGLGLKNVERRLELLYPGKYQLQHNQTNEQYTVDLKIDLE